jgi:acetolactate synthase-1/2/3 large subunit
MAGKPAATLLHLGPGLANGLANLHNARRAASPIVNIVGDHATYHAQYDAPLASDIVGFARPVSHWVHSSKSAREVAMDGARAVQAALTPPGQIATLILPADAAWGEAETPSEALRPVTPATVSPRAIENARKALTNGKRTAILIRDRQALTAEGLHLVGRIAARCGARILCDTFTPRIAQGAGVVALERIPYFAEQIVAFLSDLEQLILVGGTPPVAFFAYPGKPSYCLHEQTRVLQLSHPNEDGYSALQALAEAIQAGRNPSGSTAYQCPDLPSGELTSSTVGQIIARYMPEGAIVSDESATSRIGITPFITRARPHDHLSLTGGSIGQGMPVATGAAIACPTRKVVCLQGDGGAAYTLQALWTQAREKLDVTTVIFANRAYAILKIELARVGGGAPGSKALSMFDLHNPELSWAQLASGLGVEASRAHSNAELAAQFESAMRGRGPRLIEVVL